MSPTKKATAKSSKKASKAGKKASSKSRKAPRKASKKAARPPAKAAAKRAAKKVAKKAVKRAVKKAAGKAKRGAGKARAVAAKALRTVATAMKAVVPPPSPNTVRIENITVGMPYLRKGVPAEMFTALRNKVIREAGFDFLNVFGDMMRPKGHVATQAGVATRSRHKCGDAFDYNQGSNRLALVKEPRAGRMYWRSFLLCTKQDGSQGESLKIQNEQLGSGAAKFYYDFTMAAEALGWHRIPAHTGWQAPGGWKKREFWHYQNIEGYTFDECMTLLYGNASSVQQRPRFPTVNPGQKDNDSQVNVLKDVRQVQAQLFLLKLLGPRTEVDGVYGGKTEAGVKAFQHQEGLPATGIADEATRRRLLERVM